VKKTISASLHYHRYSVELLSKWRREPLLVKSVAQVDDAVDRPPTVELAVVRVAQHDGVIRPTALVLIARSPMSQTRGTKPTVAECPIQWNKVQTPGSTHIGVSMAAIWPDDDKSASTFAVDRTPQSATATPIEWNGNHPSTISQLVAQMAPVTW
jgi:hypothetical protein